MSAYAHRDFRLYALARLLLVCGGQCVAVALAWRVMELTRSPLHLGLIGLAQFLPIALLSFFSGTVADRFDRRRIVQVCIVGSATAAGLLAWHASRGHASVGMLYAAAVGFGIVRAFSAPANAALLPLLVPASELSSAITAQTIVFQVSLVAGPTAAGFLYRYAGPQAPYLAALLCYAGTFVCYALFRPLPATARSGEPFGRMVAEGLRFVARSRVLLGAMTLDLFAVLLGGATALLPLFAKDVLGRESDGMGLLKAAPAIGAGLAALLFTFYPLRRRAGAALLLSVAAFGAATILFGLSRSFGLSLLALALLGAFDTVSVVVRHTLIQLLTPNEMRGRVSAVAFTFISASNELGDFESGVTAAWWGPVAAVVVGGAGTIAVTLIWCFLFPALRKVDRLDAA